MATKFQFPKFYITKASGKKELFKVEKLKKSLQNAGASKKIIDTILVKVAQKVPFKTAMEVYKFAYGILRKKEPGAAGRYNIKKALLDFGPTGYPFEKFVGQLLSAQGYKIKMNQIIKGVCVEHEVDVVAEGKGNFFMVECKFHNQQGIFTSVKVPLYIKARYDDIQKNQNKKVYQEVWIVTNTKFSDDAIQYANCVGERLLGWAYPSKNSLENLINKFKFHPITALSSLTQKQKQLLMKKGIVLCRQVSKNKSILKQLHISNISEVLKESEAICNL